MREIVEALKKRINEKKNSMLITVVAGRGSIPRKAGAYMVVGEDGRIAGTIGGGNLEYQAILLGQKLLAEKKNYLHEYNLGQEKSAELGMVCGGNATVLFYYVDAVEDAVWIGQMEAAEEKRKPFWILMPLEEGKVKILPEFQTSAHQSVTEVDGARFYAEQFSYDGKVYIFGGGHLAQELVPVLSHLGFRCIVSDDREEFTKQELFPGAEEIRLIDFGKLEETFTIHPEDYIVVVTRGHLCDTDAERFGLKTSAGYIGVVGSKKKTKFVYDKLIAEGFTGEQLARVTAPIGIEIGSETPAEIAISIAAQLIEVRARKNYHKINF